MRSSQENLVVSTTSFRCVGVINTMLHAPTQRSSNLSRRFQIPGSSSQLGFKENITGHTTEVTALDCCSTNSHVARIG